VVLTSLNKTIEFTYSLATPMSASKTGGLIKVLTEGMYLGEKPYPMDEDPRLFEKAYEIASWDEVSLSELSSTIRARQRPLHTRI
jgi:hypothetical protein